MDPDRTGKALADPGVKEGILRMGKGTKQAEGQAAIVIYPEKEADVFWLASIQNMAKIRSKCRD